LRRKAQETLVDELYADAFRKKRYERSEESELTWITLWILTTTEEHSKDTT